VADDGLAIAVARETVDRAAREQTLRVQQQLRDQERLREAAVRALNSGNERCIAGQKVRRVGNGWVQAGTC
jgi:methionine aminopeptidase